MKTFRLVSGLLVAAILCIVLPFGVLAQDEAATTTTTTTPPPIVNVTLKTDYPKVEVVSGASVSFQVTLIYANTGDNTAKEFDLIPVLPNNWTGYVSSTAGTRIASINLDPTQSYGTMVTVNASPSPYLPPDPGDYKITLQAVSNDIKGSIGLTAVVTAEYTLSLVPSGTTPIYSTTATAGREKVYSVTLQNSGSAAIDNINLASSAPQDWVITFPNKTVDTLAAGAQQTIDVKIKPADKAIAGDYQITLTASGKQASAQSLEIRVTVVTPSVWGIVGVVIIVLVIAALAFVFMRFSRR